MNYQTSREFCHFDPDSSGEKSRGFPETEE
jgi:hypothetical protein